MQDCINERFDRDHLRKWVESKLPLSVLTSNGWYGQLERMERYRIRALNANSEEDSLDFSMAFFQASYHLRDWIPTFEGIDQKTWNKLWEEFMTANESIRFCRDLCNVSKHMSISTASITENLVILREFEDDGSELGKFKGWTLHVNNLQIDLFTLMEECKQAWIELIKGPLFEHLALSNFLKNDK